jgi:hypothetical protein
MEVQSILLETERRCIYMVELESYQVQVTTTTGGKGLAVLPCMAAFEEVVWGHEIQLRWGGGLKSVKKKEGRTGLEGKSGCRFWRF